MLLKLDEMVRLLAGSQDDTRNQPTWDETHQRAWENLNSRLRSMFSPNDYLKAMPDDAELRDQFAKMSLASAARLQEAVQRYVADGDLASALSVADYLQETMEEELGPEHPTTIESQFVHCQLLYATGDRKAAEDNANVGLSRLKSADRDQTIDAVYFCQLHGTILFERADYQGALASYSQAGEIAANLPDAASDYLSAVRSIGRAQLALGHFDEARAIFESILEIERANFDPKSLTLADTMSQLGSILSESGHYQDALSYLENALSVRREHLPESRNAVATSLFNLARTYEFVGKSDEAATCREELSQILDAEHPDFLEIQNGFATALIEQDKLIEARAVLKTITLPAARLTGRQHPLYASICENWGEIFLLADKHRSARRALHKTLAIREQSYTQASAEFAKSLAGLAKVEIADGNLPVAHELLLSASTITENAVGKKHPAYGEVRGILGECLLGLGAYDGAFEAFLSNVLTRQAAFGNKHVRTAVTKNNLGVASFYKEDLQSAEPLFVEALEVTTAAYGQYHRHTRAIATNLAATKLRQGQLDDAEIILSAVAENLPETEEAAPVDMSRLLNTMGGLQEARADYASALMTFRRAHETAEAHLGSQHFLCGIIKQNEAACAASMNRLDDAEFLYRSAVEILRETLGEQHPDTQTAEKNLGELLRSRSARRGTIILTLLAA